jgi:hypothetical protein
VLTRRCAAHSFCSTSWAEAYSKLAADRLSQAARYLRRGQRSPVWKEERILLEYRSELGACSAAIGALIELLLDRLGPPAHGQHCPSVGGIDATC